MSHIRLDSIALIDLSAEGQVVVSGSHGGASAAKFVLDLGVKPRLVFFNDAGGGKDDAGIVALTLLDAIDVPCAVYSHESARIGDAQDGAANGVVTHVNSHARALRIAPFMQVSDCFYIFK